MKTNNIIIIFCFLQIYVISARAFDFKVDGIHFNINSDNEKTLSVTSDDNNRYEGCIVIPSNVEIDGETYMVTGIDSSAFFHCTDLVEVFVPKTIVKIALHAFDYCVNLRAINVDDDNQAFACRDGVLYNKKVTTLIACPGALKSITLPSSVKFIGKVMLFGNSKGTKLVRKF